jgi:phage tail sheath protein FI
MPEYLAPGVYVEEVSSGNKPIAGVSSSTAGFVGATERGPLEPKFISSWLEFQRWYGGYLGDESYLAYAVEGFFANGGQRCFVARVVGDGAAYASGRLGDSINVVAIGPGTWSSNIEVTATYATQAVQAWRARNETNSSEPPSPVERWFKVTVGYSANGKVEPIEVYDNLSYEAGASNNAVNTINASSHLIRVWWESGTPPTLAALDANNVDDVDALATSVTWSGGADGAPQVKHFTGTNGVNKPTVPTPAGANKDAPADLLGQPGQPMGLAALELIDEIALLVVPDEANGNIRNARQISTAVIQQCEKLKDRFALISVDQGQNNIIALRPPQDTTYGAFYYPWIKVFDPSINYPRLVPPTGHIAGIFARTDIEVGIPYHQSDTGHVEPARGQLHSRLPQRRPRHPPVGRPHHEQRSRVALRERAPPVPVCGGID